MPAPDVLRLLFAEGVRVVIREDGPRLVPEPGCEVTSDVIELARQAKAEILPLAAELPAPGRCRVCGGPQGWPESAHADCARCAMAAMPRIRPVLDALINERRAAKGRPPLPTEPERTEGAA